MKKFLGVLVVLVLVFSLAVIGLPSPVQAATFTVNSTIDGADWNPGDGVAETASGNGVSTLRAAIQETNALAGPDTINLPAGTYTLSITGTGEDAAVTGDLDITDELTIIGADQATTIIDGGGIDRVFHILSGNVDISGVTIRSGNDRWGGGIHNRGTLTVSTSTISSNIAGDSGGGIYNVATLTVTDSTISGNTPDGIDNGGILTLTDSVVRDNVGTGIHNGFGKILTITNSTISGNSAAQGGGIYNSGTVALTNSTISGNTATTWDGGGINSVGSFTSLTLTNSTVNNNQASRSGGGIMSTLSAPVNLKNTIVANNSGGDFGGAGVTSLGHNLDSDGTGGLSGPGDISGVDPLLGPLADNGGPTFTHALLAGSPAIDAGDNTGAPVTDQRGVSRPVDGDGDTIAVTDMGAYEYVPTAEPAIEATADFNPGTLNLNSKGKWVTVYIELPESYDVEDIDVSTVELSYGEDSVSAEWGDIQDGALMVKFDRSDVQDMLDPGDDVEVTVSGELTDGTPFEGTDTIRVVE